MPALGETLGLALQLFDGATNKFVRAVVRNAANTPITGSPFTLTHVASGLYDNTTALMPSSDFVVAQYEVFTDAGFSTPDTSYSQVSDVFELSSSGGGGGSNPPADLIGNVTNDALSGFIDDSSLTATVSDC